MKRSSCCLIFLLCLLAACTPAVPATVTLPVQPAGDTPTPFAPAPATATPDFIATPVVSPIPTRDPLAWRDWPIIPEFTAGARAIYARGQALGNHPARFSKIGDCESSASWFLADFDEDPSHYSLGDYTALAGVIEYFRGSFGRTSLAARPGATAASLLTSLWADSTRCESTESPLDCELREHKPAFALIMVGSNDVPHRARFEENLRRVIERTIELGVVPVLTTKADNLEGDDSLNATIARLAVEYDLPLWNFWAAVQPLPDHGLQPDGAHLTWAANRFDRPENMQNAWPVRNLTALQTLEAMWKGAGESAP